MIADYHKKVFRGNIRKENRSIKEFAESEPPA